MNKRFPFLLGLIGVAILALTLAHPWSRSAQADSTRETGHIAGIPIHYSIGGDDPKHPEVDFDYDTSTVASVRAVAAAMTDQARTQAATGASFVGEIVFTHPIPIDEYIAFMADAGLIPQSTQLEGHHSDGRWVSYFAPPSKGGSALDSQGLRRFVKPGDAIDGAVTAMHVTLTTESFNKVVADPRVFAIPALDAFFAPELQQRFGVGPGQAFIQPSLLYDAMKKTGIAAPYK